MKSEERNKIINNKITEFYNSLSLNDLNNNVKDLEDEIRGLYFERDLIIKIITEKKKEEVLKTGVFKEAVWKLYYTSNGLFLESNIHKHTKLASLLESDFHCNTDFEFFSVYFNDGDITINFKKLEDGLKFINEFGIEFKADNLEDKLKNAKEMVDSLQNVLDLINGKKEIESREEELASLQPPLAELPS